MLVAVVGDRPQLLATCRAVVRLAMDAVSVKDQLQHAAVRCRVQGNLSATF